MDDERCIFEIDRREANLCLSFQRGSMCKGFLHIYPNLAIISRLELNQDSYTMAIITKDMQNSWTQIKEILSRISNNIGNSFNKPASNDEIVLLETVLKQTLPDSFKDYLLTFNGQRDDNYNTFFIGYNCLLSIDRIIETWKMQMDLFGEEDKIDWIKENKVLPVIWDKGWIPFTDFEANTRIAIDLNPGKNGTYGQIIQIWPGQDLETDNIVIAESFENFSKEILKRLIDNNYEYKDQAITFADNWII